MNENGLLGTDSFNYNVIASFAAGASKTEYIRLPGYVTRVLQMTVDVYADGVQIPLNVATDLEEITCSIKNKGNELFSNEALTVAQISTFGQSDLFAPFEIPADAVIEITFAHTAKTGGSTYTNLKVYLGMHGHKVTG